MYVLPDADGQVAGEDGHHDAASQAVQTIGEVHRVRTGQGDEGNPTNQQDGTEDRARREQVNGQVTYERDGGRRRTSTRLIRELERQVRKGQGHAQKTNGLLLLRSDPRCPYCGTS